MNDHRLFRQFQPSHYSLRIEIERKARRFGGTVRIHGIAANPTICLHAHGLQIQSASIDGQNATFTTKGDELSLSIAGLRDGEHEVTVTFNGDITNSMHGLYPSFFTQGGQRRELLATQFESHHAREVFPCVDEPEAKAAFELTLVTEPGVTTLGNMPVKTQHEHGGQLVTLFETTPRMSTYLLAWVVGELAHQEAVTKNGVIVRAYATPDHHDQLGFALRTAVSCLEFFGEYFGIAYPLPKCDLVALPDFSAGAMENWGLITFREALMLVGDTTATASRQYVAMVVAHELAHQWFGDLVTMRWWNDLWLNESFANWIEYLAVDHLFPDWQMWTQYYDNETALAINRDSLAHVQTIQQDIHSPDEIQALFDGAIVYAKGGSLLNMLRAYLGSDVFRRGLHGYLQQHQYGNAEADDLWRALGAASGQDVASFMRPWITQPGLPVVSVEVSNQTARICQQRFFAVPQATADGALWDIPLSGGDQLPAQLLQTAEATVELPNTDRPLLLNQGQTSYYLTRYQPEHLARLAAEVRDGQLATIDRLGLLTDSLYLAKAGLSSERTALELLESYQNETSQPVWSAIGSHISALKMFAGDDVELLAALRAFVRQLAEPQFTRLGWQPDKKESYFDQLLRPTIITHLSYAEDGQVTGKLRALVADAAKPSDIWGDIRATAFATAVKFDGQPTFDKLLGWYHATTSAEERIQLVAGLAGARDPQLIRQALRLLTTDKVKPQDLFYWIVHLSRNRHARELTWQWARDNWPWMVGQFKGDLSYVTLPKYMAASFSTAKQLSSYKAFFEPKLGDKGLARVIRQGIEDIDSRVQWIHRDRPAVGDYLRAKARPATP